MSTQKPEIYRTPVGLLNKQVVLAEFLATGTDARGQATGAWAEIDTVWAAVQPLTGRWAEYARQLSERATYRVLINYRTDVTSGMRITCGERTLYIEMAIDQGENGHTLELLCTEARS